MAYMRIHCGYCGQPWEIYFRDDWKADSARRCPHCDSKIDRQTWQKVITAFGYVQDANAELFKDHTGYHCPLYTVDYIEDRYFHGSGANSSDLIEHNPFEHCPSLN